MCLFVETSNQAEENEEETAHLLASSEAINESQEDILANEEAIIAPANDSAEVLTQEELLSFEMLEISEKPKSSHTATPNNTPLESRGKSKHQFLYKTSKCHERSISQHVA